MPGSGRSQIAPPAVPAVSPATPDFHTKLGHKEVTLQMCRFAGDRDLFLDSLIVRGMHFIEPRPHQGRTIDVDI